MSSPLFMLKKTRRLRLQEPWDKQKAPLKRNLLTEIKASLADENDSSDPNYPQTLHTQPSNNASTPESKVKPKKGTAPSDLDLLSIAMHRLTLLEEKVRSQEQEIQTKAKRISVLEEKLRNLKKSGSAHDVSCRDDLESICQQLQNQVHEMESFLNDYGLVWVGDVETREAADWEQAHSSKTGLWQPGTSEVRGFHMNFDLVQQRITELNVLAGEGESFIQLTATGAQLVKKEPIQLRLYSNGIVMFDGPFRSYEEPSTQRCMQDLMDGYFPSELQERFPSGVPFQVHDKRDVKFICRLPWEKFPGKKLSTDQFLNRLPKMVVKAGRVIDVRNSVRSILQGLSDAQNSDSVILIDTSALQATRESGRMFTSEPLRASDVVTLKVKSEDGNRTYIVKMFFWETIGHLRQYLDKHRGCDLHGYDIISAFPHHCYDDNYPLQSCRLKTNTTLLLRKATIQSLRSTNK